MKGLGPRWRGQSVACAVVVGLGFAAGASAAPKHGAHYTGRGPDYMNKASKWTRAATAHVSFNTSANGADVVSFDGVFHYYCGSGKGYITAKKIRIKSDGSFSDRGHHVDKEGAEYLSIWGKFNKSGTSAKVSYRFDFVYTGKHVKHPYSTKVKPRLDACESWVRATTRVTTG
ncbi:MAG TPA: hypothetical protein VFB39_17250 [Solirubrobacteraceae bacterium]|nr:hypothetical protein [Solirubrobacteraceae bacterium]